jgi:L-aspartate oxidase
MKPVILGAGLAGLTTALALAPLPVVLVSPRKLGIGCSSAWAQGGIAASIGIGDNAALHAADTIKVGNGLNDENIVRQTTEDAAPIIQNLISQGVVFDRDAQGALHLGLEAAHQKRRIVHAKDSTGAAVMEALAAKTRATPSIEIIEGTVAVDLIADGQIRGVTLQRGAEQTTIATDQIVLATGGAAGLWRDTTNPHENWGGGLALAARAGAVLGDLEFMQFHPTALDSALDPMPLISEALRGEGALLVDETGACFTDALQPRDIVARAIYKHIADGHRVFLDARVLGAAFATHFPNIHEVCMKAGINPTTTPIPVRPAAHYHMGGVVTDAHGRTNITGLWACGEVARTGLHGANRLASNSLLEAASFGQRVARDLASSPPRVGARGRLRQGLIFFNKTAKRKWIPACAGMTKENIELEKKIRATMSDHVGVVRNHAGLERAIDILAPLAATSDRALVGLMIAQSALRRTESRGAHYRDDFPQISPHAEPSRYLLKEYAHAA